MAKVIKARDVRADLVARRELALIDLREEAPFATAHPLFASQLSVSRLELEVFDRIPRKDAPVVLYDDGEGFSAAAASRLESLGYANVSILEDGLKGWRDAGYELFQDVNSYSKAFGELVESRRHTPSLPAPEVRALLDRSADMVVLDARRYEEYNTMSIPGSISTPGAELVLRAQQIAPDPSTAIIVNCAGRTRSLIGAQSLVNAGLPNPVYALRNGTIGWTLAGQTLEHGQTRRFPQLSQQQLINAREKAREVAYRAGVKRLDISAYDNLVRETSRTLYRFDVRTPEEFTAGHLPQFRSAPGGQLVQETDVFAPVRGARIVLSDHLGPRADMTASWLAQLGWEVYVLDVPNDAFGETGAWRASLPPLPSIPLITATQLVDCLADTVIVDLAPSPIHRKGHVPGARFAIRSRLADDLKRTDHAGRVVLTSPDGALAAFAAADLIDLGIDAAVLDGGTHAWITLGRPVETGLVDPLSPANDVYKRPYEGTDNPTEAMQAYLDWEYGLVDQLARDGTHGFFVI